MEKEPFGNAKKGTTSGFVTMDTDSIYELLEAIETLKKYHSTILSNIQ